MQVWWNYMGKVDWFSSLTSFKMIHFHLFPRLISKHSNWKSKWRMVKKVQKESDIRKIVDRVRQRSDFRPIRQSGTESAEATRKAKYIYIYIYTYIGGGPERRSGSKKSSNGECRPPYHRGIDNRERSLFQGGRCPPPLPSFLLTFAFPSCHHPPSPALASRAYLSSK